MQVNLASKRGQDILLLIFSILGSLIFTGRGVYLVYSGFFPTKLTPTSSLVDSLFEAAGMLFCAALILPLIIYCIQRLKGQEFLPARRTPIKVWQAALLIGVWGLMLLLGSLLVNLEGFARLAALPFFLLGIAIPVGGIIWVAIGGLSADSWKRLWAAFGIGLTGSSAGAILVEYSFVGVGLLAAGILVASNPEWRTVLHELQNRVTKGGDIQGILTSLAPTLTNPWVFLLVLAFAAVLAPIIEETLKPAAVWLLGKRLHSPAEGFALGALGGAGFALLEGTLAASGSLQLLGVGLAARAASSLMHITASGIMGWGIASAILEKRHARLAASYFLAIGIHGMWNGAVVLAIFGALRLSIQGAEKDLLGMLMVGSGILILGAMLLTIVVILPIINQHLRRKSPVAEPSSQSVIIAPLHP